MGVSVTSLISTLRQLPTIHLAAAIICTFLISLSWMLLPADESDLTSPPTNFASSTTENNVSASKTIALPIPVPRQPSTLEFTSTSSLPITQSVEVEPAPQKLTPTPENWVEYQIQPGDNLTTLFNRAGLNARDVYRISSAVSGSDALKRLHPGESIAFLVEDGQLNKLRHIRNRLSSTLLEQTDQGYRVTAEQRTPELRSTYSQGVIENSLFLDAAQAGMSDKVIMELASIFGWDVDFALDIRSGDSFHVLYEDEFLDGEKIGEGDIIAAKFINQGITYAAVRYTDSNGETSYYTPEGRSMRKAFLRSPVDFRRISSHFKPERYHPVLGQKRPHRGVDYAAATGTPLKAAGDGKIIWRGTKGGYGRTIIIQHGGNITTLYAHMSRYQKGIDNGSRVQQGDIIGYVGSSGLATGPHLHYEFRINGVHKNPLTVALPQANSIPADEMPVFTAEAGRLMAELESLGDTRLALNGAAPK